ncbi:MAG: 23S rRNA (pseudouridine(1915)-N(3))-methyltransferase RlmH [Rhizobiaceae bacterium]
MRLEILAVGRLKAGPERELYDRYADRISKAGRQLHLTGPFLTEIIESRSPDAGNRKQEEAQQLLTRMDKEASLVVLDERGKDMSSQQFSELLRSRQEAGNSSIALAMGGPDGHSDEIKTRANHVIRFGSMTWPHQLARVMLVEQLYRAVTILAGHPYHRE